jgi:hypothetical protein
LGIEVYQNSKYLRNKPGKHSCRAALEENFHLDLYHLDPATAEAGSTQKLPCDTSLLPHIKRKLFRNIGNLERPTHPKGGK